MNERINIMLDVETLQMLNALAKDTDRSKAIRFLIHREYEARTDMVRVNVTQKIDPINEVEFRQARDE
jgi:hypothetical protein